MAADLEGVVRRAAALKASGRVDDAMVELTTVLADDTGGAVAWELALIALERHDWPQAESLARRAVRNGGARYASGLGQILARAGDPDEALDVLAIAHRHDPTAVAPLVFRCALLAERRQYDEALRCLDQVLALEPDHPSASMRGRIEAERAFLGSVHALHRRFADAHGFALVDGERVDATIEVPSASLRADGTPRFRLWFSESLVASDLGAAHLFHQELTQGGYERPLRQFLDAYLASDDVFIDVGAHWGVHALTAATLRPGEIDVVAVEGHPDNSARLRTWVERNGLADNVDVVAAAAGDRVGTAVMMVNGSTMGHTLRSGADARRAAAAIDVPLVTLDSIRDARAHLRWRRTFLKVDVEGYEREVLHGAAQLLASGDVVAVIWENGDVHAKTADDRRSRSVLQWLTERGYVHHALEASGSPLPLSPLDDDAALPGDIVSLRPGVRPASTASGS
jgi:FkbM family methyltransferase